MDARVGLLTIVPFALLISFLPHSKAGQAQKSSAAYSPAIPKTWDEEALASLEVPLADPGHSPKHISAEDYYRLPVRPIYKSYPQYEPSGYRDWLRRQEPIVLWDNGAHRPRLETEADWIKAGEIVFDAPVIFFPGLTSTAQESREFDATTGDFDDKRGISPFADYVIRERGKVEIGLRGVLGPTTEKNSSPECIRDNAGCLQHHGCGQIPTVVCSNSRQPKSRPSISRFRPASSPVRARAPSRRPGFPI